MAELPQQKSRTIEVLKGDFNEKIDEIPAVKMDNRTRSYICPIRPARMFGAVGKLLEKLASKKKRNEN